MTTGASNNTNKNNPSAIDLLGAFAQFACAPIVSLPGLAAIAALRAVRDSKKKIPIGNRNANVGGGAGAPANAKNALALSNPVVQQLTKEVLQSVLVSLVSRQVLGTRSSSIERRKTVGGGLFGARKVDKKRYHAEEDFRLVCVTGTYQEGYANREMLDSGDRKAVFVGYALVRGCGLHFDVKADEEAGEDTENEANKDDDDDEDLYDENDIAPVVVLTNDKRDAVVYSVYAVPCDAIIANLFDSGLNARLMGVSSDTVAIDLAAVETSTSVRVAAQANEGFGFALTMLSFARPKKSSVCARPLYEKRDGTRVYTFNDEQLENCGITSGSSLAKIRAICASSGENENKCTAVVEEVTEIAKKTEEKSESPWPMNLLRSTGLFEDQGDSAEKKNEEEKEERVEEKKKTSKKKTAPLGESANAQNGGNFGFLASFLSPVNVSANKKSSTGEEEENRASFSATTQQTPGALGDQVLYPATVASPWPDESKDVDEDYVPDYEAEDFDYDDEPLSGGSSLLVTPTKEATGGTRRNGSFYESAATTPNAEKAREEPRPFGSVNAVATASIASTSSPTEEEARSSEFVYSVDSESEAVSIAQAFKEQNSHWGENNKIEKAYREHKMPLGGAVDVARLYTCTRRVKEQTNEATASTPRRKSSSLVNKSTRLVDFASCQRAMTYAETFHNSAECDSLDGGVLPRSRAVWLDGRRCRI
jgi:DNA-binding transcriptional MerR regulator